MPARKFRASGGTSNNREDLYDGEHGWQPLISEVLVDDEAEVIASAISGWAFSGVLEVNGNYFCAPA